jgi:hypothetical protein
LTEKVFPERHMLLALTRAILITEPVCASGQPYVGFDGSALIFIHATSKIFCKGIISRWDIAQTEPILD